MKKSLVLLIWCLNTILLAQQSAQVSSDFEKYGMQPGNQPEVWEDGMRTTGEKGTYEWWYFDAHLNDGSTAVIIFMTKPFVDINKGIKPFVTIEIDRPDGTSIKRKYTGKKEEFKASKTQCDVQVGKSYFTGNLELYEIHVEIDDVVIDAIAKRTTESWRPETGHLEFGDEHYFAWIAALPTGNTEISYQYQGTTYNLTGTCYHDHNWGNEPLPKLLNHWYWSRAQLGPYNIIAAEMIAEEEYNYESFMVFNISKDGTTRADDGSSVILTRTNEEYSDKIRKPVFNDLSFSYHSENDTLSYEYTLHRETNILEVELLAMAIPNKRLRSVVRFISGFDGSYVRMTGTAQIKVYSHDQLIETHESEDAVWELMFFGKPSD